MIRRNLIVLGTISLVLSSLLSSCRVPAAPDGRPNIIFVFTDDHAAQAVGAYGGLLAPLNPTPNIDRLAKEGLLFRNAFVTNSICAPSRAVILTGLHSHLNGIIDNRARFDSSQVTFPKLLQGAGYQTAVVGKWHLKSEPTGFDYWEVLPGQGKYYNPDFRTPQGIVRETGYVTDIITDKAIDWLSTGRATDRPFMLMYQHKAPHRVWAPGPEHLTKYDDVVVPEVATLFDDHSGRAAIVKDATMGIDADMDLHYDLKVRQSADSTRLLTPYANANYDRMNAEQTELWDAAYESKNVDFSHLNLEGDELVRWKYQRYVKDYLRTIASVDDNLGRLLDFLDSNGLAENTILVYNSDQGFYLGEHGWFDKRWMYEESLRSPLIVRWPAVIAPGSETRAIVQNLDFAPTFLQAAGADIPNGMQGIPFNNQFEDPTQDHARTDLYYHYYESGGEHNVARHYGIRTDRHKLIYYYEVDQWELFDLDNDSDELNSVYGLREFADIQNRLEKRLHELQVEYEIEI